jgi:hypothetical protein
VLDLLGDPHRVGHVGLATGQVVQVLGVDQPHLELGISDVAEATGVSSLLFGAIIGSLIGGSSPTPSGASAACC